MKPDELAYLVAILTRVIKAMREKFPGYRQMTDAWSDQLDLTSGRGLTMPALDGMTRKHAKAMRDRLEAAGMLILLAYPGSSRTSRLMLSRQGAIEAAKELKTDMAPKVRAIIRKYEAMEKVVR